jgi:hypothetical protein
MSKEQSERFAILLENYTEWKRLRKLSSQRGAAVIRDIWPLFQRFYELFPARLADHKFDGLVTVGDLYEVLCRALKVEPHRHPESEKGVVREQCKARPQADMTLWAREYHAWREAAWTPEDVWATLVSTIVDVYKPDASLVISSETVLRKPNWD